MTRDEDMVLLIDRWAELGDKHQMLIKTEHDPWPRATCWTRYTAECSCGVHYPTVSATDAERRNEAYLSKYVETLRTASHLKHRVQELLGEEWTLS